MGQCLNADANLKQTLSSTNKNEKKVLILLPQRALEQTRFIYA